MYRMSGSLAFQLLVTVTCWYLSTSPVLPNAVRRSTGESFHVEYYDALWCSHYIFVILVAFIAKCNWMYSNFELNCVPLSIQVFLRLRWFISWALALLLYRLLHFSKTLRVIFYINIIYFRKQLLSLTRACKSELLTITFISMNPNKSKTHWYIDGSTENARPENKKRVEDAWLKIRKIRT